MIGTSLSHRIDGVRWTPRVRRLSTTRWVSAARGPSRSAPAKWHGRRSRCRRRHRHQRAALGRGLHDGEKSGETPIGNLLAQDRIGHASSSGIPSSGSSSTLSWSKRRRGRLSVDMDADEIRLQVFAIAAAMVIVARHCRRPGCAGRGSRSAMRPRLRGRPHGAGASACRWRRSGSASGPVPRLLPAGTGTCRRRAAGYRGGGGLTAAVRAVRRRSVAARARRVHRGPETDAARHRAADLRDREERLRSEGLGGGGHAAPTRSSPCSPSPTWRPPPHRPLSDIRVLAGGFHGARRRGGTAASACRPPPPLFPLRRPAGRAAPPRIYSANREKCRGPPGAGSRQHLPPSHRAGRRLQCGISKS